jgi:predicted DNA-binding transcriptional regulator YafY
MSTDPRTTSHARLHETLSRGRRLKQQTAADELGVSPRQVRNLVDDLQEEGVPVRETFENRERVYYLDPADWHADTVTLDLPERQLLTLLVATKAARPTLAPTPLSGDLEAAAESLEEALGGNVVSFIPAFESERWHFDQAVSVNLNPAVFWPLKQAIADRRPVSVDYYSAYRDAWSRGRRIDPLLFAVRRGAWLCVAYCHRREAVLDFNMVDIEEVEVAADEHYQPPSGFNRDQYFEGRFGALAGEETHEVCLRVADDFTRYFERKLYHPTQQVSHDEQGEGAIVTFEVAGLDEISSFVLSWGAGVEVLSPASLVDRVKRDASAVVEQYE